MQGDGLKSAVWVGALCLLSGCGAPKPVDQSVRSEKTAVDPRFNRIKTLTQQSCLCELAGRDHRKIDVALKAATTELQTESFAESSAPLASLSDCYPELGDEACTTSYYPTSAPDSFRACTMDQVQDLETAWRSGDAARNGSAEAGNSAMLKRLAAMRQELAKSIPLSACN
jgi:hypothetical protein